MTKRQVECPEKKRTSIATGEPVRFGSVLKLDRSTMVGTPEWKAVHSEHRVAKLSAWRGLHNVASVPQIRSLARSLGHGCSSNMTLTSLVAAVKRSENAIDGSPKRTKR